VKEKHMQWHFEFKDWEEAFELFYRRRCGEELKGDDGRKLGFRKGDPSLVFVISTASYTSGYWIEPGEGAKSDEYTTVYRTVKGVRQLEERIRRERAGTVNLSLGGVVT
jgi:hypothetical protein